MIRLYGALKVFTILASFPAGRSLDSINMDLEVLENIDLHALGTPTLDRYQASYEVTVDDDCNYQLQVDFIKHPDDTVGNAKPDFQGVCAPSTGGGNAPDGLQWHEHRRHWMQFPDYVYETTGFNHMSLYWKPCGTPPLGFRQPSYHMNFYPVTPQYRVYWTCQEYKTPRVCRYNQTSFLGRAHFSLPRLARDPDFLANMPKRFQPDEEAPEAFKFEGLVSYDKETIPQNTSAWEYPKVLMSTYDGDVGSWKFMIPYHLVSGRQSTISNGNLFYVHQTKVHLPAEFNTTYNSGSGKISVVLTGSAGMCGSRFEDAKGAEEGARKLRRGEKWD